MVRTVELTGGLEARVADPLWMLSRQWQVGEFRGDDAAQPAAVRILGHSVPLATFRARDEDPVRPFPTGVPLEALAEGGPPPDFGSGGLHASARAGRRLARMLRDRGLGGAVDALRSDYGLTRPDPPVAGGPGSAAVALLVRWGLDGARLAGASDAEIAASLAASVSKQAAARAATVITEWRAWYGHQGGNAVADTWEDERLEYSFTVGARGPGGEVVLRAPEHTGQHLDWYTFDLEAGEEAGHGLGAAKLPPRTISGVPTPVRYAGMPASRWWEFEDGEVHFGDLEAGPADLARLLLAEFATSYGADWFVLPVTVPVGTLTELRDLSVVDTFGGNTPVPSVALTDRDRWGETRAWRLFELAGDSVGPSHPSPWLLVAPSLASSMEGPALERVVFARDEAANLAWGIERLIEGPLGRAVDRADTGNGWHASAPASRDADGPGPAMLGTDEDWWWRYRLEATAPPWWIPLVAERVEPRVDAEVRLRRARMQDWALLDGEQAGPMSTVLDPRRPRWLYEEEVPRGGVDVSSAWQLGRWHDGSVHLWLQRRKRPGRGERSSGVRWDLLDRVGPSDASGAGTT
jgi:hypothetical protein